MGLENNYNSEVHRCAPQSCKLELLRRYTDVAVGKIVVTDVAVGKIDNCKFKFKFRTKFSMTRIKPNMQDSNILDSTNIINMISKNMIIKWI